MPTYIVRSDKRPEYTLCENDMHKSVLQNIYLLITTRQGTVPLYREFGIPMSFLDMPSNMAETVAAMEIENAVDQYEPRAKIDSISCTCDLNGRMVISVKVTL